MRIRVFIIQNRFVLALMLACARVCVCVCVCGHPLQQTVGWLPRTHARMHPSSRLTHAYSMLTLCLLYLTLCLLYVSVR